MSGFFGDDRQRLHDSIIGRINLIASGDESKPRIIVLEGLSGVGKSRIVREVYETLRASEIEGHPQYWPTLTRAQSTGGPHSATVGTRKIIGPPVRAFTWEPDALPTFLWWSLNCEQLASGDYSDASSQLEAALRWHSAAILLAWRALAPMSEQVKAELARTARGIRDILIGDKWDSAMSAADIVESLAGAETLLSTVPGLGIVVKSLKGLFRRLAEERGLEASLAQRLTYGETLEDQAQAASSLAQRIRSMALPTLVAVVAVEDAHRMDPKLARLLDRLSEAVPSRPVLVLCTAWPVNDPASPYEEWKARAAREGRIEVHKVGDLDIEARRSIIESLVPGTREAVKAALAGKWLNPLCLELFLSWDEVRPFIVQTADGPALELTPEQVRSAPSEIADLYQARWSALDPQVKRALLCAAGCLPAGQPMHAFAADLIAQVVSENPAISRGVVDSMSGDFLARMEAAREGNWTLNLGDLETFREVDLAEIVARDARNSLSYEALQDTTAAVLAAEIDALRGDGYVIDVSQPRPSLIARWLMFLDSPNHDARTATVVARLALARESARAWQYEAALATVERGAVLMGLNPDHPHALAARLDIAAWIGEAGDIESARQRCEVLLEDCTRILGPAATTTLLTRRWLAHFTGLCGAKETAREMFVKLVEDAHLLEDVWAIELNARSNAALWTGEVERYDAAVSQLDELIDDCSAFFGRDHHETLENRRLRARFTGEGHNPTGARDQYRTLVEDCLRMFTPTNFETLECRRGLARWTSEAGEPEAALPMYRSVADDCERIYGPTHFLTLWAWLGLADALAKAGDRSEAMQWARKTHEQANRAWSPTHRLVTNSADRIAAWRVGPDA